HSPLRGCFSAATGPSVDWCPTTPTSSWPPSRWLRRYPTTSEGTSSEGPPGGCMALATPDVRDDRLTERSAGTWTGRLTMLELRVWGSRTTRVSAWGAKKADHL